MEIKVSLVCIGGYMLKQFLNSWPRDQKVIIMDIKVSQCYVMEI